MAIAFPNTSALPCPECGQHPIVHWTYDDTCAIFCANKECKRFMVEYDNFQDTASAVNFWNKCMERIYNERGK
jgi:hypothetical protein